MEFLDVFIKKTNPYFEKAVQLYTEKGFQFEEYDSDEIVKMSLKNLI